MTKILILNDLVYDGGAEMLMKEVVKFLSRKEYDITLATIINDCENIKKHYPTNVHYISIEKAFEHTVSTNIFIKKLYGLKRRIYSCFYKKMFDFRHYDVAIAIKEGPCMKFLSKINAKKKYGWVHVDYNHLYWTKTCFNNSKSELQCMQMYNNIVCVSEATKKSVCEIIGDPGNLIVRMNPLDVEKIIKSSEEELNELERYKLNYVKPILVTVGGLREEKGYLRLLECCKKLNNTFNYDLWIVGDGPEKNKLEKYIQENNLKNVTLWGMKENPYPFIKRATFFVSSSFSESYGLSVQEAIILNKPVLATMCPAFEECIDLNNMILVENKTDALYQGLYKLLENPTIKEKYEKQEKKAHEKLYIKRLKEIEKLWLKR